MHEVLCLAYGSEADWLVLSKEEQSELLRQDRVIRDRGNYMSAVVLGVTTVSASDALLRVVDGGFAHSRVPLAGFSIIEADDIDEVVALVAKTPCARAGGAIEVRRLMTDTDSNPAT